jgi:chromosome partition protein MukE
VTESRFPSLGDVVLDEHFPDVDIALRRGRHVDREDIAWYSLLIDAQEHFEPFYRRFGCELVHASEGYFYLLPTAERLGRRHLSVPEMLVGQTLALLYLDPATLQQGGAVTRAHVLSHLASVLGSEALTRALNPKRKRMDERAAEEQVRGKFAEALRRLAALGFVDLLEADGVKLRAALMRFAEPVRGQGSSVEALEQLVARGELVLGTGDAEEESELVTANEPAAELAEEPEEEPLPEAVLATLEDLADFAANSEPLPPQDEA